MHETANGTTTPAPPPRDPRAPNALIIGAMKSSTTLLFDMLALHPKVFTPSVKEPHYFASRDRDVPGAWDTYLRLFEGRRPEHAVAIEASTTYTRWPQNANVAPIIRDRLGAPRLIYILRDPVARIVSHHNHSYARGFYPSGTTLRQAIDRDPMLVSTSRYHSQVALYDEVFGPEATLIILAEELHKSRLATLARVAAHLGLEPCEAWSEQSDSANTAENVRSSAAWRPALQRMPWLRAVAKALPPGLRSKIKGVKRPPEPAPKPSQSDLDFAFDAIADDLERLERRVGPVIHAWPSWARRSSRQQTAP